MSDWTDRLKAKKDAQHAEQKAMFGRQGEEQDRIAANLPHFWTDIVRAIKTEARRIEYRFPDDASYHADFMGRPSGFTLRQKRSGKRTDVDLKLDLLRIRCRTRDAGSEGVEDPQDAELAAEFDARRDRLYLKKTPAPVQMFYGADAVAEWIVEQTCDLPEK